jgi:rabenosyn-5
MLPLKSLPKILKHASPHGQGTANGKSPNGRMNGALSAIKLNDGETPSEVSSSSAIESMEAEEKDLRERLIVLEEQKFIVSGMIVDARKRRKFDEEKSLSANVEDLTREIDGINGQLASLREGFRDVYEGMRLGSPMGMGSPAGTPLG